MSDLDYSDYVNIKIIKVQAYGEPSHWELDVTYPDGSDAGGGTSPNFSGIFDMAHSIIRGGDKHNWDVNDWTDFDANDRKNNG